MSTPRPSPEGQEPEDLLRDLLTGARSESDPRVRNALAADPELAATWRRHQRVEALLAGAGKLEETVLKELDEQPEGPGEEHFESAFRELTRERPAVRGRRFAAYLTAAAALIVAGVWLALRPGAPAPAGGAGGAEPGPNIYLGGPSELPELLEPRGPTAAADLSFRWVFEPVADWGGSFEIQLRRPGSFESIVRGSLPGQDPVRIWVWKPSNEQLADIPTDEVLEWQVTAVSGRGDRQVSERQSFTLVP